MVFTETPLDLDYSDRILEYNCNFNGMQLQSTPILTSKPLVTLYLSSCTALKQSRYSNRVVTKQL